ncbi:MAG: hypothetical protein US75_C0012G0011 [Candidatus Woesebacteria bacterium GW2011_GWC1_38_13]|uniref:Uncharacterized protein n=3 Tax=Candidatus Woeseibacteriota TaxID=1752722 RepID=A0A0G0NAR3_9BACT|nr:MAG: hypothetical protein US67_C0066G0004 [Candidatus Woesebacteria bacterium GW2011_GWD1_38_10]KKQ55868.1 MAG: hypothetical protein US75_C0012G0011 [Candidatus Woesebacteria bacterium GW2011_GWC1_38_13]KKQ82999.1 MAG: hypothetical protein UT06_C0030G0003 [Candidatus Woesebacteria bacterium GW2011_GWA1_38_8]
MFRHYSHCFGINTPWTEILTALGTILASIIALTFGLWGKTLRLLFYKSNMCLIDHLENLQIYDNDVVQGHTRLKFKNKGMSIARNVMVYIMKVKDNGKIRENFLPVPLAWTHDGRYARNFSPQEVWFLDLCRKDNIKDKVSPNLVLAAGQGVINYQKIEEGKTILQLRLSQSSSQVNNYFINLHWKKEDKFVTVDSYKLITSNSIK